MEHEFMVLRPAPGMSMHEMHQQAAGHIGEDQLQPGATRSTELTFQAGHRMGQMELACYLPGHYEAGMTLPVTIE